MSESEIKAVAFDVDGTLVSGNFWIPLHTLFHVPLEDDREWMRRYHERGLDYRGWMNTVSDAWKKNPLPREIMEEKLSRFSFLPGAEELVETLKPRYPIALISSNIAGYIEHVASQLAIDDWYAFTDFDFDEKAMFREITFSSDGDELEAKVEALKDFAMKNGILPTEVAFVGDSRNDLDVFKLTGKGILIGEGNEDLRGAAWKRVNSLSEISALLQP